jgi:hypothetical protein
LNKGTNKEEDAIVERTIVTLTSFASIYLFKTYQRKVKKKKPCVYNRTNHINTNYAFDI